MMWLFRTILLQATATDRDARTPIISSSSRCDGSSHRRARRENVGLCWVALFTSARFPSSIKKYNIRTRTLSSMKMKFRARALS